MVVAAGLHAPGGLCASADGGRVWVTDRLADKDALYRVQAGKPLTTPAWTWSDKPGVAGCADFVDANGLRSRSGDVAGGEPAEPTGDRGGRDQAASRR